VGTVLRGLSGTREGHQLDYATNHLFYEIADMLRGPIRFITNELEGLARVMHVINAADTHENIGVTAATAYAASKFGVTGAFGSGAGFGFAGTRQYGGYNYFTGRRNDDKEQEQQQGWSVFPVTRKYGGYNYFTGKYNDDVPTGKRGEDPKIDWNKKAAADKKVAADHIQPILSTSFGNVADLQNKMQALSTENPAQERGLSLIETIAKAVIKMAYGQKTADDMFPENSLTVRND
jgi:hypothetical protein